MSYLQTIARRVINVFRAKPTGESTTLILSEAVPQSILDAETKADQAVNVISAVVATLPAPQIQSPTPHEESDYKKGKQVQTFFNESEDIMEITIEYTPDLYLLKPGQEMRIFFDPDSDGTGLYTMFHEDGSLQIFLENYKTKIVTINGRVVEPWNQLESQKAG
jgi:hypothetical protein